MNFISLQKTVRDLIAAHATFAPDASIVFQSVGDVYNEISAALDISSAKPGKGYAISVWPPARGHSDTEQGGISGVDVMLVVRFEVNPKMLIAIKAKGADPCAWLTTRIKDIINAVLSAPPENGGVRFQLTADPFELVNFDEGLVAYHIRFARLAVFGQGI